jgi:hypothetical protein
MQTEIVMFAPNDASGWIAIISTLECAWLVIQLSPRFWGWRMKTKNAVEIQRRRDEESHAAPGSVSRRRLEEFRAASVHKELAVVAALDLCAEEQITPPQWLVKDAAKLMVELLKSQKTSKVGRTPTYIAQFRQHLIDLKRWNAVLEVRRIRDDNAHEAKIFNGMSASRREHFEDRRRLIERYRTWLKHGTYRCAAMYLRGQDAYAGTDAIRTSYRKIQKAFSRDAKFPALGDLFIEKIGLSGWLDAKPGKKHTRLYDLEP